MICAEMFFKKFTGEFGRKKTLRVFLIQKFLNSNELKKRKK